MTDQPSSSESSVPSPVAPASKGSRSKMGLVIGIFAAILLVAGTGAGLVYSVYAKRSGGPVVRAVTSVLPLPAGRVGSRTILYRDFLKNRDTLERFLKSPAAAAQQLAVPLDATLEKNVLEKMMHETALNELANEKNVNVSDDELRKYFTDVVAQASSTTPDIGVYLLDNFGWSEEDFRQNVLRPALLEEKLGTTIATEKQGDPNALSAYLEERLARKDVTRYLKF